MSILLYRPQLDVRSGAGQLVLAQAVALEAAGETVELACARGALKFRLRAGRRARRMSIDAAGARARQGGFVVDHGPVLPDAQIVFVHNCYCEAVRILPREDWQREAEREAAHFARLDESVTVVANSELVKRALSARLGIAGERIEVRYPGHDPTRFNADRAAALRRGARAELDVPRHAPLVGFVTSGELDKRGLDVLLDTVSRVRTKRPDVRCLVVGAKRLPSWALEHALARDGFLHYRAKGPRPERFMAALDVFVFPAHFEEFGLVVLEAMALGVPVLTSWRVGAAERMPVPYAPWLIDRPDAAKHATLLLRLLEDDDARSALAEAGMAAASRASSAQYATSTAELILAQKRRLR